MGEGVSNALAFYQTCFPFSPNLFNSLLFLKTIFIFLTFMNLLFFQKIIFLYLNIVEPVT